VLGSRKRKLAWARLKGLPRSHPAGDRLIRLLGYSNPFAASEPIQPSPAMPGDFVGVDPAGFEWMFDPVRAPFDAAEIMAAVERDTSPIPATINREGYFGDFHFAYWCSGFATYKLLAAIARSHGIEGGNYFDFGGSTGRVFRHFHFQSDRWKVWSCDFKMTSVEWNLKNFPNAIQAFQGMYFPVLPVEDRTFDLVSAMSVFTHIDETETSWLLELRRTMKPGGIAIVTVHNDEHWPEMPQELRTVIETHSPEFAANKTLPPGRFVSTFRIDDPYRCNTFHSNDYIREQWSRFFEVCEIIPRASGAQSAVILRRRD
jgi:SAM-dependent methyltransferase